MVACKFFLQGNCKFGNFCNFDHQIPSKYSYSSYENNQQSTSILRQSAFGTQNAGGASAVAATPNVEVLIKSVNQDMTGAEKGGQWLLSCYAPFKEKPAFPGFEDQSPEEIRLGFYEAQKTGTVEQYKQQLQTLLQNTLLKVKALQNPSPEVIGILQNIYNSPLSGTVGQNTGNIFSSQSGSSVFGQAGGNQNIFGAVQSQPSSNIFGATAQPSNIFAGNNATSPSQNQNIFATTNTTFGGSPFGGQQPSSNIFATAAESVKNQSNIFGTNQLPVANSQPSGNIFATQPQNATASNIFASQPFQNAASQPNIFASSPPPQTNIFTNTVNQQTSVFNSTFNAGSNPPQVDPPNYSASIFGNTANNTATLGGFGNPMVTQVNLDLYSKIEELSERDKNWFQSNELDLNIPDDPPTYEMCFPK